VTFAFSTLLAPNYAMIIMVITVRVSHWLLIPAACINPVFMIANVTDVTPAGCYIVVAAVVVVVIVAATSQRNALRTVATAVLKAGKLKTKQRRAALPFD